MSNEQVLTKEIAEFLAGRGDPQLDEFTSIDDSAAECLSKHTGWISLRGLTGISNAAAESLSRHDGGRLVLVGITELTDAAAESLSRYRGRLCLGLTSLSDSPGHLSLAEKLCERENFLALNTLIHLSDEAAKILSNFGGPLCLDGLTSLSDTAAESLGNHKGNTLSLRGVASLSDAAAASLSKHEGSLILDGLTVLSDAAAASLSTHEGSLSLAGLTSLPDSPGHVSLAERLCKTEGFLDLRGLTYLSDASAASLSKHKGLLTLDGLPTLSDAAAASLGKHKGSLRLNGLTELTNAAAASLSQCESLELNKLTCMSEAAASAFCNKLKRAHRSLKGLTAIGERVAEIFAKAPFAVTLELRLSEFPTGTGHLNLAKAILKRPAPFDTFARLTKLSPELALLLSKSTNDLALDRLESLPAGEARLLAQHKKGILRIGVKSVDAESAGHLAKHGPKLFMPRLEFMEDTKQHRQLLKKLIASFYTDGQKHLWGGNCLGFRTLPLWLAQEIVSLAEKNGRRLITFTQLSDLDDEACKIINRVRGSGIVGS